MRTSMKTIMSARSKQHLNSIRVQGFKCQEIEYKRYMNLKRSLKAATSLIDKLKKDVPQKDNLIAIWYKKKKSLEKEVTTYEKKHNINQELKKPKVEKKGLMNKVRSLFSRRKK